MISVTQPRRPADDFLASLQANLQPGNGRSTRRRGRQRQSVADESDKKTAVAKEQKRARPPTQQKPNRVKSDNINNAGSRKTTESKKSVKQSTKPGSVPDKALTVEISSSVQNKPLISADNVPPERAVVPEIVPPLVEQAPAFPQQPPQPPEVVQAPHFTPTYQHVPTQGPYPPPPQQGSYPPPPQQGPRQSQNNFYLKNQSNIFNTGWNSYGNTTSSPRVNNNNQVTDNYHHGNNQVTDNVVLEKALRIASQQPLPPPPTFSTHNYHHGNYHQDNSKPVPNPNLVTSQQHVPNPNLVTSQQHVPNPNLLTTQQHLPSALTGSVNIPLNSHYTQSFSISGGGDQDNRTAQELERRKWIQELEAQVQEKKERDQREKLRRRSPYLAPPPSYPAPPPPHPQPTYPGGPAYSSVAPTYPTNSQQPIAPHTFPQTNNTHQSPQQNTNFSNLQPPQNILLSPQTSVQPQSGQSPTLVHKLGQHAWVDPLEQERRTEARRRALENQEIIRRQVEDRERLKREEQERRKWEEELEIRKIEEEKRRMAEEVRMEQEKVRKKEQAQLEQIAEMRQKIEEANKSALELKRGKRCRSAARNAERPSANTPKVETQSYVEAVTDQKQSSEVVTNKADRTPQKESRASGVTVQGVTVQGVVEQQLIATRPVQQIVRYVSNAATQTVSEVSCQTVDRENSFLPTETKLITLQERELSVVQRQQTARQTAPNNKRAQSKERSVNKPPIRKEKMRKEGEKKKMRKVSEAPKFQYDDNGRRIRAEPPKEVTPLPTPSNIIAEESVAVTEYSSIADIFDDPKPKSHLMGVESVGPSPFSIPDQQIQMRYISPQNEERNIPSAISARQNDILNQLEKLRMGLKDRRRHMSAVGNDQ